MMDITWIQIINVKHAMFNALLVPISIHAIHAAKDITLQMKIPTFALNAQLLDASYAIKMVFVMIAWMDISLFQKITHALHAIHHVEPAKIVQIIVIHVLSDIMMSELKSVINAIEIAEHVQTHHPIAHHVIMDFIWMKIQVHA